MLAKGRENIGGAPGDENARRIKLEERYSIAKDVGSSPRACADDDGVFDPQLGIAKPMPDRIGERGLGRIFLAGLALDFCVRYSAEDAYREGFGVVVVEDACRGIDVDGSMAATRESFRTIGIVCATAEAIG
jgi:nicotinamidase-related amidase